MGRAPLRSSHLPSSPATLRLVDQFREKPPLPARHYRQKAAEARRAAEGVTTPAIKARLDVLARDFDRLAEAAESAARQ